MNNINDSKIGRTYDMIKRYVIFFVIKINDIKLIDYINIIQI